MLKKKKKKKKNKANSGGEGKITIVEQSYNDGLRKRSKRRQSRCWINLLGRSCICRTSLFFSFGGRQSQPAFFPPAFPPHNMPGVVVGERKKKWKKKTRSNSEGVGIRFSSFFVVFKQFYITERVSGGLYR